MFWNCCRFSGPLFVSGLTRPFVCAGDVIVRRDGPIDPSAVRFEDLLDSFALIHHDTASTHRLGGNLDVVGVRRHSLHSEGVQYWHIRPSSYNLARQHAQDKHSELCMKRLNGDCGRTLMSRGSVLLCVRYLCILTI